MAHRIMTQIQERLEEEEEGDLYEYVSDCDKEETELAKDQQAEVNQAFPTTIFLGNLPIVGKAKYDRLLTAVKKRVDAIDSNSKVTVEMPMNEQDETQGFAMVTFETQAAMDNACPLLDGLSLDKAHTFKVVKLDKFDEVLDRQDEFRPKRNFTATKTRKEFREWLLDPKCREQILLRYQSETEIFWHDTLEGQPVLCYGGEREKASGKIWCDWRVEWSPQGSYLATIHKQGIAAWAGPEFTKQQRFAHDSVKQIQFSPNEEFLLTWNGEKSGDAAYDAVRIHRVLTGELVKKYRTPSVAPLGGEFPHFLWSHDGRYYAECNENSIIVRDTDTFEIIKDEEGKKKTLKYDNLSTFQWSPTDNVLAVWTLEKDNAPARLVIVEIPSRKELTSRSRTQVEASMYWQSQGEYLCLLVTKLSKTKKRIGTNLELFRVREKNIPVETVEIPDQVRCFEWETKGNRFSVLTQDEQGMHTKLGIFQLGAEKCEQIVSFDLPSNSFNRFFWAPEGQYFVIAGIGESSLLFAGLTHDNKLELLHKDEHFMLTNVQWDPSSRFVITAVTQPMDRNAMGAFKYSMEAGWRIWTFQGRELFHQPKEKLYQACWRPHPPSMLSTKKQNDIRKDIKKYSKKYDLRDDQAKESARAAFRKDREERRQDFQDILSRLNDWQDDRMDEEWAENLKILQAAQELEEQTFEEELDVQELLINS